jgi:hypothetical protein
MIKNIQTISQKLISITLISSSLIFTACSSKNEYNEEVKELSKKQENLPSWVIDDKNLSGVGSATYRGQSYIQQLNQAKTLALADLGRKLEVKVDSLMRDYYSSVGFKNDKKQNSTFTEESSFQTISSVSSQVIKGAFIDKTYVAEDGELFVLVKIDSSLVAEHYSNDAKLKQFLQTRLNAEESYKTLKEEVKDYKNSSEQTAEQNQK